MMNILKTLAIVMLLVCTCSGVVNARHSPTESPYDPFVEPETNVQLMNEALLFELGSRIDQSVSDHIGKVYSSSYEVNGIRADGHGGFDIRIHGWVALGTEVDEVNIYFDSPHFNSGLVFSRIDTIQRKHAEK